jgi:mRNA interferase MazF
LVIAQGDVCWADLPPPVGSGPGFRRPVVVVQGDALNRSRIATVICVPLTSNLGWADAPGNTLLRADTTALPKDSVANVSQIVALDRSILRERVGRLSRDQLELLFSGIDVVLGRAVPRGRTPRRRARRSSVRPRAGRAHGR